MKAITIRNVPPKLARIIEQKARRKGMSISKAIIALLEENAGIRESKQGRSLYHDLDSLAGSWSKQEADAFERLLSQQRKIDEELWK